MPLSSPSTVLLRTQSDERLIALARGGHERAFEAIVERYRRALLRETRRYLPEARAEDALQQTLVAAWTALRRGDDVRELRPWLYRIARNTALNQLRLAGYDYAELREALSIGPAPQDEIERRSVVRQTLAGLAELPERQREALLRIAVEGRGQEEVARELGVSEGAVRQLVHRARVTLRAAATALVPMPVAGWAAGAAGGATPAVEVAAGTGTAAVLAKAGAVAVLAGGAVAGPAAVLHHHRAADPQRAVDAAARPLPKPVPVLRTATATATARAGDDDRGRGSRHGSTSAGDRHGGGEGRGHDGGGSRHDGGAGSSSSRGGGPGPSGGAEPGSSGDSSGRGSPSGGRDDGGSSGGEDRASTVTSHESSSGSGEDGSHHSGSGDERSGPSAIPTPAASASATPESGDDSGGHGGSGSGSGPGSGKSGH